MSDNKPTYQELFDMVILAHKYVTSGYEMSTGDLLKLRQDMDKIMEYRKDWQS
jgi:hypothetical protein